MITLSIPKQVVVSGTVFRKTQYSFEIPSKEDLSFSISALCHRYCRSTFIKGINVAWNILYNLYTHNFAKTYLQIILEMFLIISDFSWIKPLPNKPHLLSSMITHMRWESSWKSCLYLQNLYPLSNNFQGMCAHNWNSH